ncbi:MAG TPA: HesA/MoeB/ThiF family protein [Bacteroidales bacterium]|nr:HesA/MoeB/ThiF family protein [Bacteroidales bacterium]
MAEHTTNKITLSKEERDRYQKLINLKEMGDKAQLRLKASRVLVIGAGGLGSGVLPVLCASGIGHLGIVEKDNVDASNLQRQTLYKPKDKKSKKIESAIRHLQGYNPGLEISPFDAMLDTKNAEQIIQGYDLVLDCTDNFKTRFLINDTCARLNIPLVYASVNDYEGQVMVLHYKKKVNLRHIYEEDPSGEPPAEGIIPTLPHITGAIQANEALKLLTGTGHLLDGHMLVFNAYSNQVYVVDI